MIYITKNAINLVSLELAGNVPFDPPGYLFEFQPEWTLDAPSRYFTTPDISPHPERYNLFQVYEFPAGATGNQVQNQEINLFPGQYRYTVYAGTGPINISQPENYVIVQVGRMFVDGFASVTGGTGATSALYS